MSKTKPETDPNPPRALAKDGTRGTRAGAGLSRPRRRRRWLALLIMAAVAAAFLGIAGFTEFSWASLQERIAGLNSFLVVTLMAILPVAGFSVSVVYLVAGAKFGPAVGGVVVAFATAAHLFLTHWISRSFVRAPLLRLLARKNHHLPDIPPGENGSIAVMAALVPGLPYFARNYLLALSGMPLRTYFWICLPIYVARSYVAIFLGDLTGDPSSRTLMVLVAVYAVKLGICGYLLARLRRRYKLRQAHSSADLETRCIRKSPARAVKSV